MKKVKPLSTERCSYCKTKALWKSSGLSFIKFACQDHQTTLAEHEAKNRDDGHMSEADHHTWGRF